MCCLVWQEYVNGSVWKSHVTYLNHWVVVYVLVGFRVKSNTPTLVYFDFYCHSSLEIVILFRIYISSFFDVILISIYTDDGINWRDWFWKEYTVSSVSC